MGRPALPITADQVAELTALGWTTARVAGFFGTTRATLYRRFQADLDRGRARRGWGAHADRAAAKQVSRTLAGKLPNARDAPCFGPTCPEGAEPGIRKAWPEGSPCHGPTCFLHATEVE